jgi:hypothetical protein
VQGEGWYGGVSRGWGTGGEMTQTLYVHMNKKIFKKLKINLKKE